jgi:hypothetical protein
MVSILLIAIVFAYFFDLRFQKKEAIVKAIMWPLVFVFTMLICIAITTYYPKYYWIILIPIIGLGIQLFSGKKNTDDESKERVKTIINALVYSLIIIGFAYLLLSKLLPNKH